MSITKLPITLVIICRNSGGRLKSVIEAHKDLVSEVVVVDQSSDDGTWEEAQALADYAVKRRNKGKCEGDRNLAFELGKEEWVLNLDDDEFLSDESKSRLDEAINAGCDVVWLKRKNFVDGVEMSFMGEDPQCRLFRRGSVRWSDKTHTYAEKASNASVLFSDLVINHIRTYEQIKKTHERRSKVLEPDMLETERSFIEQVERALKAAA
jgi:glycosyltransferase involved in cell wall biosynthesis